MKKTILNLGKTLNNTEQKAINGGSIILFCQTQCWINGDQMVTNGPCEICKRYIL